MKQGYVCWVLDEFERAQLLRLIPPEYANVVAHHVTFKYSVPEDYPLPPEANAAIVGEVMDRGVQAMVVSINGVVDRPDGGVYHCTWSLGEDMHASMSNNLLQRGWWPFAEPIPLTLTPAFIPIEEKEK